MAIKVSNTTVISDSRELENITNLKTIGGQSILGSGNVSVGVPTGTLVSVYGSALTGTEYLLANGSVYLQSQYPQLFTQLGYLDAYYTTSQTSGTTNSIICVRYLNNTQFVAVGSGGTILTSTDATTWTARTSGSSATLGFVDYLGGQYIVAGEQGTILTSSDAVTWTTRLSAGAGITVSKIVYTGTKYVAAAGSRIFTSTDGATWNSYLCTSVLPPASGSASQNQIAYDVLYVSPVVYIVGKYGSVIPYASVWTADNPDSTWTIRTGGSFTGAATKIVYGNGIFVAALAGTTGSAPISIYSTNGTSWSSSSLSIAGLSSESSKIKFADNKFVIMHPGRTTVYYSTDGSSWSTSSFTTRSIDTASSPQPLDLEYYNNMFIATLSKEGVVVSADAVTWQQVGISNPTPLVYSVAYANSKYVFVGSSGLIETSTSFSTPTGAYSYNIATEFKLPNLGTSALFKYYIKT